MNEFHFKENIFAFPQKPIAYLSAKLFRKAINLLFALRLFPKRFSFQVWLWHE
jgi:hypothetical protein